MALLISRRKRREKPQKRKAPNVLRIDPTRTATLRRAFTAEIKKRFARLRLDVVRLVRDEDAFGLEEQEHTIAGLTKPPKMPGLQLSDRFISPSEITTQNTWVPIANAFCPTGPEEGVDPSCSPTTNTRWRFHSSSEKVKAFQVWLKTQIKLRVLGDRENEDALWRKYVEAGFKRGAARAFDDVKRKDRTLSAASQEKLDFYRGSRDRFLRDSFYQPETVEKVKLLAGRAYDDLEGVTEQMSKAMSRTLTDGLVEGKNPRDIAGDLAEDVDGIGRQRGELIARTEIIRAHSEGMLDSFEALGVEEVGVMVEWLATDDDRVCPRCAEMEGVVLTLEEAHGQIPLHPNCLLPGNLVQGRFTGGLKAWYSGKAVEVVTELGSCRATLTVNHPVFSINGLIAAGQIKEGYYLLCHVADEQSPGNADIEHGPAMVEKVFEAFEPYSGIEVPSRFDLDGDEQFFVGKVNVVSADTFLGKRMSGNAQGPSDLDFMPSRDGGVGGHDLSHPLLFGHSGPLGDLSFVSVAGCDSRLAKPVVDDAARDAEFVGQRLGRLTGQITAADGGNVQINAVPDESSFGSRSKFDSKTFKPSAKCFPFNSSFSSERLQRFPGKVSNRQAIVVDPASVANGLRVGFASELDVPFRKSVSQYPEGYASFIGQLSERFPGKIAFRKVVEVRHAHYSGFVYDLETVSGYFTTNQGCRESIIISNCRCSWTPANVGESEKGQIRGKAAIDEAAEEAGVDIDVSKERPESIF
jgi:SPP1 gp7 family putative phage head morphogenesis protein